jgi:Oxidoreductase molybdopterin binding domain
MTEGFDQDEPRQDEDDQPDAPSRPAGLRYSRRWFLVLAGAFAAGVFGVYEVFHRGAGGGGGLAGSIGNMFGPFPVRSVESVPHKTLSEWTIQVDGLVDKPLTVDAATWGSLERLGETVDFHCVEGWTVDNVKWAGVAPKVLLERARVRPEGAYVVFHALGGEYVDSLPLSLVTDPRTMLADTLNGGPLPAGKVLMGAPARVVRDVPEDELLENQ